MAYEPPNEKRRGPGRPRKNPDAEPAPKRKQQNTLDLLDDAGEDFDLGGMGDEGEAESFAGLEFGNGDLTGDTVQEEVVEALRKTIKHNRTPPAIKLRAIGMLHGILSKLPPPPPKDTVRGELVAFLDELRRSRPLPDSIDSALSGLTVDG